jgi:hypothetical protein
MVDCFVLSSTSKAVCWGQVQSHQQLRELVDRFHVFAHGAVQVECEHQLGIEREGTAAALKQRDAAEARTAALEAQFTEYVATQRNAPEAKLKAQLAELQQAAKASDAKLQAALKLKQKYKQQVRTTNCLSLTSAVICLSPGGFCVCIIRATCMNEAPVHQ